MYKKRNYAGCNPLMPKDDDVMQASARARAIATAAAVAENTALHSREDDGDDGDDEPLHTLLVYSKP